MKKIDINDKRFKLAASFFVLFVSMSLFVNLGLEIIDMKAKIQELETENSDLRSELFLERARAETEENIHNAEIQAEKAAREWVSSKLVKCQEIHLKTMSWGEMYEQIYN